MAYQSMGRAAPKGMRPLALASFWKAAVLSLAPVRAGEKRARSFSSSRALRTS